MGEDNPKKSTFENQFDNFLVGLQDEINEQNRQDFSAYALDLGKNPYNYKELEGSVTTFKRAWQGPCGDTIYIELNIQDDRIIDCGYHVDGCVASVIAGSQALKLVDEQTIMNVRRITEKDVLDALGTFPEENWHCVKLALTTINMTLDDYEFHNS